MAGNPSALWGTTLSPSPPPMRVLASPRHAPPHPAAATRRFTGWPLQLHRPLPAPLLGGRGAAPAQHPPALRQSSTAQQDGRQGHIWEVRPYLAGRAISDRQGEVISSPSYAPQSIGLDHALGKCVSRATQHGGQPPPSHPDIHAQVALCVGACGRTTQVALCVGACGRTTQPG
jgi:hypothetical protein